MYNYYARSSECFHHYDDNKTVQRWAKLGNFIYCLNDNDGYNIKHFKNNRNWSMHYISGKLLVCRFKEYLFDLR